MREDYIVSFVEKHLLSEKLNTKLAVFSSVAAGRPTPTAIGTLVKEMGDYFELTLPYMAEKSKIRSKADSEKLNDPAFWKALLDKRKTAIAKDKQKTKEQ